MRLASFAPPRVLAVYAHPDDADIAAGGVMALWASSGAHVDLVVVCDGSKGSHSAAAVQSHVVEEREKETRAAADVLGIRTVHTLGYPDGEVSNVSELREQLVSIVRTLRPTIVIGPDPTAVFFGGVYINHRDHREVGWALLDAVAPAAAMPLYYPRTGAAHQVETLLLTGTHEPDIAVSIAAAIDQKVAAVLSHGSQLDGDVEGITHVVRSRASQSGQPVGAAFAEVFRCVELG